jgi:hypothetical protein
MVGPGGCRRSDHSGEVKLCTPDSGDMSLSNQEGVWDWTIAGTCTWMYQTV